MPNNSNYYSYIQKRFRKVAWFYDYTFIPIRKIRENTVVLAGPSGTDRILDVCTGTGEQALAFAKRGNETIGTDISEAMLSIANKKNNYPNLKFMKADAISLPFRDSEFDLSCASFGLHEMPEDTREKALDELRRVTKNGGKIIIVDFTPVRNYPGNFILKFLGYTFLKIFECRFFSGFVDGDFYGLLAGKGLPIVEKRYGIMGFAVILKCENRKISA